MSTPHDNDKQFLIYQLKWMGIYVGIGFVISLVLPFPVSLVGALGAFLFLNFIRTRRILKRSGIDMKGLFRSFSSASSSSSMYGHNSPLKYYCMSCGKEHKEIACPNWFKDEKSRINIESTDTISSYPKLLIMYGI